MCAVAARLVDSPGNGSVSSARSPASLTSRVGGTGKSGESTIDFSRRVIASSTRGSPMSPTTTISAGLRNPAGLTSPWENSSEKTMNAALVFALSGKVFTSLSPVRMSR